MSHTVNVIVSFRLTLYVPTQKQEHMECHTMLITSVVVAGVRGRLADLIKPHAY